MFFEVPLSKVDSPIPELPVRNTQFLAVSIIYTFNISKFFINLFYPCRDKLLDISHAATAKSKRPAVKYFIHSIIHLYIYPKFQLSTDVNTTK
jgi:hypothetical protein